MVIYGDLTTINGDLWGFMGIYRGYNGIYPLVMTNSLPWYRWPIEIDGLPGFTVLKNGDFLVSYVK